MASLTLQRSKITVRHFLEDLGNDVDLDMILVPGGDFLMGSLENEPERVESEGPLHKVDVEAFLMGRYPVTQAQWQRVASMEPVELELDPSPSRFKGTNRPVEKVSWDEAVEFCRRLSIHTGRPYRLPSEAEWEYACRARPPRTYSLEREIVVIPDRSLPLTDASQRAIALEVLITLLLTKAVSRVLVSLSLRSELNELLLDSELHWLASPWKNKVLPLYKDVLREIAENDTLMGATVLLGTEENASSLELQPTQQTVSVKEIIPLAQPFYFGETLTPELANYYCSQTYSGGPEGKPIVETTEVGRFPPNSFGVFDMHGNVFEWCQDIWHDNYEGAPTDGSAWLDGVDQESRILRGGTWDASPGICRSASRVNGALGVRIGTLGFRVVCVAPRT